MENIMALKQCQWCKEMIDSEAQICPRCRRYPFGPSPIERGFMGAGRVLKFFIPVLLVIFTLDIIISLIVHH